MICAVAFQQEELSVQPERCAEQAGIAAFNLQLLVLGTRTVPVHGKLLPTCQHVCEFQLHLSVKGDAVALFVGTEADKSVETVGVFLVEVNI